MKLLIHTPISNRAWCLPEFLRALSAQELPAGTIVQYLFDVNDSQDKSFDLLETFAKQPSRCVDVVEHPWPALSLRDHQWNAERYRRMIFLRNAALVAAHDRGCQYLFSVDSDVILKDPDTLSHLMASEVPVIAGVFMSTWGNPAATPLPNVWQTGQNEMSDDFLQGIATAPKHVNVGGLGACTLIRRDVWESGVNYNPITNLPLNYRGEDRYFCVRAAVHGIHMEACSHKRIRHVDREISQVVGI
jgi:hypothetical protein